MRKQPSKLGDCIRAIAESTIEQNTYDWDDTQLIEEPVYDVKEQLERNQIIVDVVHVRDGEPALLCSFSTNAHFVCELHETHVVVNPTEEYNNIKLLA